MGIVCADWEDGYGTWVRDPHGSYHSFIPTFHLLHLLVFDFLPQSFLLPPFHSFLALCFIGAVLVWVLIAVNGG